MKNHYSLKGLALLLVAAPFVGSAWAVTADLAVSTPAARPSTCSASVPETPSVTLSSNGTHDGKLKVTANGSITVAVVRTGGDHPELENLRVKFELNPQALVTALSPYVDGVTAEAFRFGDRPDYPITNGSQSYRPTSTNNNATLEWVVGMNAGTNSSSEIGITLEPSAIGTYGGTLKFLDTNSVNVTVPGAYTVTCSVERI